MSKKNIIYTTCAIAIALIIAFAVYFAITANKSGNPENESPIFVTKYNDNFEAEKVVEITDKKQLKEFKNLYENPSLEQDDMTTLLGIKNDIKVDFGNGKFFMIQEDLKEYCYYEDANSNSKLVIKMPEGILEKVNNILNSN